MQCLAMQELVAKVMDRKIETEDYQQLYKSDIGNYVDNLNNCIRK